MMPPAPAMMQPAPTRAQRSFTRIVFGTLATAIFGFSLLLNFYLIAFSGLLDLGGSAEGVVRSGASGQKIAVIPVHGVILDDMASEVLNWLDQARADSSIQALVIEIDTPGGSVSASDVIHHRIEQLKADRGIPVVVSMGSTATSGGYYIACASDHIIAQPTTLTGNIGVLMPRFNLSALADRWGVNETTITAPSKGFKNAGSMFSPENPTDTAYLQDLVDEAYSRFTSLVVAGRGPKLRGSHGDLFNGQVFTAKKALDGGLVDEIGYLDDAYSWAAQQAGLSDPTVVRFSRRPSLMQLLTARSNVSGATGQLQINVDAKMLDEMSSPKLMYLWKGN